MRAPRVAIVARSPWRCRTRGAPGHARRSARRQIRRPRRAGVHDGDDRPRVAAVARVPRARRLAHRRAGRRRPGEDALRLHLREPSSARWLLSCRPTGSSVPRRRRIVHPVGARLLRELVQRDERDAPPEARLLSARRIPEGSCDRARTAAIIYTSAWLRSMSRSS